MSSIPTRRSLPMRRRLQQVMAGALALGLFAALAFADDTTPRRERLRPGGIDGSLVICGGGTLPDSILKRFLELAGGEKAHLVIIPTASDRADQEPVDKQLEPWQARMPASVVLLHTRSRQTADEPQFVEPLRKATGVWFGGGSQARILEAYRGTAVEKELCRVLERSGVIGGTSAGAAIMSPLMIASGNLEAKTAPGFNLLPGTVVDQHFLKRNRQPRLVGILDKYPGLLGLGIDEGTALVVRGREMRVLGESTVTVCLAGSPSRPPKTIALKAGTVADLTALRRAAIARAEPPFPPKEVPVPQVPQGTLVIVGGGGMPAEVTKKFIELAGGPDARIVVLPTAGPDPIPANGGAAFLQRAGARNVQVLAARELADVEARKSLDLLQNATGIWFGGGRQWRFVDAYEGTKARELFCDVLRRGGVIGGSSAGATIQGDYLCRGSPLGNLEIMYEGYERGLAFLPGVAIDQHFTQRKRLPDMTALMKTYPQLLGIGIDEGTALIVKGEVAEVMGRNQVHFYDRTKPVEDGQPDYEAVKPGSRYDLRARKVLPSAEKDPDSPDSGPARKQGGPGGTP
jgi:cyanophycinase